MVEFSVPASDCSSVGHPEMGNICYKPGCTKPVHEDYTIGQE